MRRAAATLLSLLVFAPAVRAQAPEPRLDWAHPVVGETMVVTVDRVEPGTHVTLQMDDLTLVSGIADGSGVARFEMREPVPANMAGRRVTLRAILSGVVEPLEKTVVLQHPSLLVTGTEGNAAYLYHFPMDGTFEAVHRLFLGTGEPGGAVRDGRGTKTFVVADRFAGIVKVIPDDPAQPVRDIALAPGIRGIDVTEDGRRVVVVGSDDGLPGWLAVIDTHTDLEVGERLRLDPLGDHGGQVVVAPDGLRAFVAVDGVYLREINLFRGALGELIRVGRPGQSRILDLRLVDGSVVALSVAGALTANGALSGFAGDDLHRFRQVDAAGRMSVGSFRSAVSLFLLDGQAGEVTVLDPATLATRDAFAVPAGADALLLAPDRATPAGALLYGAGTPGAFLRPLATADGAALGEPVALTMSARAVPVLGKSRRMPWLFLAVEPDGLLCVHAEFLGPPVFLPLPVRVRAVSLGR